VHKLGMIAEGPAVEMLMQRLEHAQIHAVCIREGSTAGLNLGGALSVSVWISDAQQFPRATEILAEVRALRTIEQCPGCQYDLRGHHEPSKCPECGVEVKATVGDAACPQCDELVPATFEVCWNCGGEMSFAVQPNSCAMRLSHVNVTMPAGGEDLARSFYAGILGLPEIPKPEPLRARGGVWFDAGGIDLHLSVEGARDGRDQQRHFGLACADVDRVRARLEAAGVEIDLGRPAPWKRLFAHDPFGNRIEFHEADGLRG